MAALNVDYIAWIITVLGAITVILPWVHFWFKLFSVEVKNFEEIRGKFLAWNKTQNFSILKRKKLLELCQSKTLKVASKFLSPMLNFQSHWRPAGHNFGALENMGVLFSSFGVLGGLKGLRGLWGLCFQDTQSSRCKIMCFQKISIPPPHRELLSYKTPSSLEFPVWSTNVPSPPTWKYFLNYDVHTLPYTLEKFSLAG